MTGTDEARSEPLPMTRRFPMVGPQLQLAYRELTIADKGDDEQVEALGDISALPRPWDPASCMRPDLREELWVWLEEVVDWLNHEYIWDEHGFIPQCWPKHPHLVHEIAVVADQRRRAGIALTSDALEDWHRYCLPAFVDRMKIRCKDHCGEGHRQWPARGAYTRYLSDAAGDGRRVAFAEDIEHAATTGAGRRRPMPTMPPPHLASVNLDTGEVLDDE